MRRQSLETTAITGVGMRRAAASDLAGTEASSALATCRLAFLLRGLACILAQPEKYNFSATLKAPQNNPAASPADSNSSGTPTSQLLWPNATSPRPAQASGDQGWSMPLSRLMTPTTWVRLGSNWPMICPD